MKKTLIILLIITSLTQSFTVEARTWRGILQVFIGRAITFTELNVVDFGTIPNTNGTCTMDASATLSGTCVGAQGAQLGEMRVKGTPLQYIDLTLTQMAAVDGVTFEPRFASNGGVVETETLSLFGRRDIQIMGNLVLSGATTGAKTLNYTLTVNYQ